MPAETERILSALRCGKAGCLCARGKVSHCPVHGDAHPSLSIAEKDGKLLVHCLTGCSQEAVIGKLREMKVWPEAVQERRNGQERTGEQLAATYEYRNADGELVAVKGRFESPAGKTFKWRLPTSQNWDGLGGMPLSAVPLWGAELIRLASSEERVYLVEGEKAAKACRAMGLLALTLGGGAGTTDFGDALVVLRGRNVVLWPDNDDPGRKLMDKVRSALRGVARSVVTIFPIVPPKGDAVEFFGGGNTLAELAVLVPPPPRPIMEYLEAAEDEGCKFERKGLGYGAAFGQQQVRLTIEKLRRSSGELRAEVLVESAMPTIPKHLYWGGLILSSGSNREKLGKILENRTKGMGIDWDGILEVVCRKVALAEREGEPFTTAGDVSEASGPTDWCINDFAPRKEATTVFGDGGVGKSMLTLALSIGVKAGIEIVPGFSPVVTGNVLYLDWEASRERLDSRVKRICTGAGIKPVRIGYRRCSVPLVDQVEEVMRYCQSEGVALVVVDSVEMAMNGTGGEGTDPNDKVIRLYSALRYLNATTCLIDHVSSANRGVKEGAGKAIGGIFKRNLARMAFELRKGTEPVRPNEVSLGLFNTKRNDDGAPMKPIGLNVEFGPDSTRYTRETVKDRGLMAGMSVRERMVAVLKNSRPLSIDELVEEVDAPKAGVKTELSRWGGTVFVKLSGQKYGLATQPSIPEPEEEIPF